MADEVKKDAPEPTKVVDEVKDTTKEATANMKPDVEQVSDVQGIKTKGEKIYASSSGNEYLVKPCSLKEIPELVKHVKNIEENMNKTGNPVDILTDGDGIVLKEMSEVILLGIHKSHPNMNVDKIMDEFSLGDFPDIYKSVLDVNDFLSGMRRVYQVR